MFSTIQPIGKRPERTPRPAARTAMPPGMPKTKLAQTTATTSAAMAAQCAAMRKKASATSMTTTGRAAKTVERAILPMGSYTWVQVMRRFHAGCSVSGRG